MTLATQYAEAASTYVSHLSHPAGARLRAYHLLQSMGDCNPSQHGDNGPGIKLRDLAHHANQPVSALGGVRLLWTRFSNRGTDRHARRSVE